MKFVEQNIKTVRSADEPSPIELLQGKALVNFNVEQKTSNDGDEVLTYYTYKQIERPRDDIQTRIDQYVKMAKIQLMQEYLDSTDYISSKYQEEVVLLGNLTETEFINKYQEVLNTRSTYRNSISTLRAELGIESTQED